MLVSWGFAHNSPCGLKQVGSTAAALLYASNGGGVKSAGSLRIVLEEAHIACGDVEPRSGSRSMRCGCRSS